MKRKFCRLFEFDDLGQVLVVVKMRDNKPSLIFRIDAVFGHEAELAFDFPASHEGQEHAFEAMRLLTEQDVHMYGSNLFNRLAAYHVKPVGVTVH